MSRKKAVGSIVVDEPNDSLLMAPTRTPQKGEVYVVAKLKTSVNIGGTPVPMVQSEDGIIGYFVAFDDYEKALKWADGDSKLILIGKRT